MGHRLVPGAGPAVILAAAREPLWKSNSPRFTPAMSAIASAHAGSAEATLITNSGVPSVQLGCCASESPIVTAVRHPRAGASLNMQNVRSRLPGLVAGAKG